MLQILIPATGEVDQQDIFLRDAFGRLFYCIGEGM